MHAESRGRALLALGVGVAAISWSAIFVRWTGMPGLASAFYRVLLAAGALWLLILARPSRYGPATPRATAWAALGGVFFAADVGSYNVAVLHTGAGSATFLGNNAPLVVGLLTWAINRRLPSRRFWTALAVALTGAVLIVTVDARSLRHQAFGDDLALLASVCFALYLLVTENLRGTLDALQLTALSSTASATALLLVSLAAGVRLTVPGIRSGLALVGLGLVCQVGGYLSLTYALGHLPATVSSVVLLAVAPLTAVLALLFFHERMTPAQLLGGALILLAVWIVSKEARQPTRTLRTDASQNL